MQRKTLFLVSFFFLSIFFFVFFLTSQPSEGASIPPASNCANTKTDVKTCVGVGYTLDQAIADGKTKCTTACTTSQNAWCAILCTAANNCACTKGGIAVSCTIADPSCIVYDADGDIKPTKTTGQACVVDCKTPCDAACSGNSKARGSRNGLPS
ncbi:hypothetical protein J4208_06235 [Candidatus Woesearchaeota archaeon]|nr:hypothetical protein [Candidatus Woesearchaeota archaeon]